MENVSLRKARSRVGIALAAMFGLAACSGQSCSCMQPIPGGFNTTKRAPNAIQARVGMQGINFLQYHVGDVLRAVLPGGLSQHIPSNCSSTPTICCETPDPQCVANVNVTSMALNPTSAT